MPRSGGGKFMPVALWPGLHSRPQGFRMVGTGRRCHVDRGV